VGVPIAQTANLMLTGIELLLVKLTANEAVLAVGTVYTDVLVAAVKSAVPKIPDAMIIP